MELRLTYRGKLPSQSSMKNKAAEKHKIRLYLHSQLKNFWRINRFLVAMDKPGASGAGVPPASEELAARFEQKGLGFVPLIGDKWGHSMCPRHSAPKKGFPWKHRFGTATSTIASKCYLMRSRSQKTTIHLLWSLVQWKIQFMCCFRMTMSSLI